MYYEKYFLEQEQKQLYKKIQKEMEEKISEINNKFQDIEKDIEKNHKIRFSRVVHPFYMTKNLIERKFLEEIISEEEQINKINLLEDIESTIKNKLLQQKEEEIKNNEKKREKTIEEMYKSFEDMAIGRYVDQVQKRVYILPHFRSQFYPGYKSKKFNEIEYDEVDFFYTSRYAASNMRLPYKEIYGIQNPIIFYINIAREIEIEREKSDYNLLEDYENKLKEWEIEQF